MVWINVPDLKKEKELCLRLSKNTGSWDWDSLAKLNDKDLLLDVGFEEIDIEKISMVSDYREKNIDIKDLGIKNKCPKCGYEW